MYVTCMLYVFYMYFISGVTPKLHRSWTKGKKQYNIGSLSEQQPKTC